MATAKKQIRLFDEGVVNDEPQTFEEFIDLDGHKVKKVTGNFWTHQQRQASSIHEISYRACFKPQLPRYFIERYSSPNDVVYDPFGGRGTTAVEAALLGRRVIQNDINPISKIFSEGRLAAPTIADVTSRLDQIHYDKELKSDIDLSMFYHEATLNEILNLRDYFAERERTKTYDNIDAWIRMVATNRLTGHSAGFFSVYTFPPNQAVSAASQVRINAKRNQVPTYKDTKQIIAKKSKQLLSGLSLQERKNLQNSQRDALFIVARANQTPQIKTASVSLVVTSPPFLDVVQYKDDNWLRCWFNNIDSESIGKQITMARTPEAWAQQMKEVLKELYRVMKTGGRLAFEVGEVRNGKVRLDEVIAPEGIDVGFQCESILINSQRFTKTSNIWGITNNESGTNSNRIVVFQK